VTRGAPAIVHPSLAVPSAATLVALLDEARGRLLALVADLREEQLRVPLLPILNPFLWEIGHVAWFQEKWNLRRAAGAAAPSALQSSLRADADALFDSAAIAHDTRWQLAVPRRDDVLAYLAGVLAATKERLRPDADDLYFAQLALFHEQMHVEALAYTRQTLALPRPSFTQVADAATSGPSRDAVRAAGFGAGTLPGDVEVAGGSFSIGARPTGHFVFDNEKWEHAVAIAPFRIARAAVTQGEFAEFVDAGGYTRRDLWSDDGWKWREQERAEAPVYWRRESNGRWLRRRFDEWRPIAESAAMVHVNWFEADAWCRWRGRRLPTEAEWELAASGRERRLFPWGDSNPTPRHAHLDARFAEPVDVAACADGDSAFGCRQMLGNVWEWTSSTFEPYPGFVVDPYAEYSQPWFGWHKVLRGGCLVTSPWLIRNTWRNWYTPDRRDVWAGFRSCAS
jgi:iron(II)-dependent oxidoreductase